LNLEKEKKKIRNINLKKRKKMLKSIALLLIVSVVASSAVPSWPKWPLKAKSFLTGNWQDGQDVTRFILGEVNLFQEVSFFSFFLILSQKKLNIFN
jgi:hypothetical protein